MPSANENKLRRVTIKEACLYGRISKTRMHELLNAGKVVAYKDGKLTLVDLNSVDAYHAAMSRRPTSASTG